MSQIKIKNFGPIKSGFEGNDGYMDIRKVTTFIGDQSTGKSSVAKLFSTMSWLEKSTYRLGKSPVYGLDTGNSIRENFAYFGIENYLSNDTEIHYVGDAYEFHFKDSQFKYIAKDKQIGISYQVPKLMYVPAERNLLSIISSPEKLKYLPEHLLTFIEEFDRSQKELSEYLLIPITGDIKFEYQKHNNTAYVKGVDYKIKLSETSSGLQSLLPLFLVSRNLALSINAKKDNSNAGLTGEAQQKIKTEVEKILADNTLSKEVKEAALQVLSSKFTNTCFINIVEEIEQNLFPSSQKELLFKLLEYTNLVDCNQLLLTTHSPYIINYLTLAIKGKDILNKINDHPDGDSLKKRLSNLIPSDSCISSEEAITYMFTKDGRIKELATYEGMPSDNNYLNESLSETNQLFDSLLDIEEDAAPINFKLK